MLACTLCRLIRLGAGTWLCYGPGMRRTGANCYAQRPTTESE